METLLPITARIAARLKERKETIAIAESSAGGLISAALLAVPGASAYFRGGAVVYTRPARAAFLGITAYQLGKMRPSTEQYAILLANTAREKLDATWALSETGATGPSGNAYGDMAGHACIGLAGPVERAITLETGHDDRVANMRAFAKAALELLEQALG